MKLRRIFALAGVILLVVMYLSTLIFSLMGGELAATWFKASILCTIIVPIYLYIFTAVYKWLKNRKETKNPDAD